MTKDLRDPATPELSRVTRRGAVASMMALGGLATVASTAAAATSPAIPRGPSSRSGTAGLPLGAPALEGYAANPEDLVSPLAVGSRLADWMVAGLLPLEHGATGLLVRDVAGHEFQIDVCARDDAPDAPRPPAQTEHFDLFLSNGGDGAKASVEPHGLAAMALAEIIRQNEARLDRAGYLTLRQRLADVERVQRHR